MKNIKNIEYIHEVKEWEIVNEDDIDLDEELKKGSYLVNSRGGCGKNTNLCNTIDKQYLAMTFTNNARFFLSTSNEHKKAVENAFTLDSIFNEKRFDLYAETNKYFNIYLD